VKRQTVLTHEFVEYLPQDLQEGKIYVSLGFATAAHKCCCGCGNEVVTPLSPTDWKIIFDGESISLDPSIGNWSFACGSHYWIVRDRVKWARRWSREEIEAGRLHDGLAKESYFDTTKAPPVAEADTSPGAAKGTKLNWNFWRKLRRRWFQ